MTNPAEEEAFSKACRFLSYRQRTEYELRRYLNKGGYEEAIDSVMDRLKRAGLVNDRIFAESWIDERSGERGYGRRRLRMELIKLGIGKNLTNDVLESHYPENLEEVRAGSIAARQWPRISGKTPRDRGRKLYAFLLRRGFDAEASKNVVDALLEQDNDG